MTIDNFTFKINWNWIFSLILAFILGALCTSSVAKAVTLLMVPQGGTGAGTLTGIVVGNGTGAFTTNTTGDLTSDLNIDSNTLVVSYDDNKIGIGTAAPVYALDVVGNIQTDSAFYGDYWISSTGNSMNIQPTGDLDDFFSFKTPADRPTIKREGGKYIYVESSNVNDVGISFRKDADHSGTVNYYKDTEEFGLTSKNPLVFKACEDYDDYIKICAAANVPEISTVGAADLKINAGGSNSLLLNHAGGNVAVGATSTGYILGLGTGDTFGIGTTQWNSADKIDGTKIKDADYGDVVIDAAGDWQVSEATALSANGANCGAGNYPLGVDASGAVESCTADANTTYTAGRSLTLDGTTINSDSELYHHEKCLYFEDPTADDDFKSLFHFRKAATITGMWCESDQTVNMDLQLDDGTPADINGTDLVCDSTPADDTSMGGDTGAGAGERLDLVITSVSGTPTWVSICFDFTYDD